jgi:hypothetical protein
MGAVVGGIVLVYLSNPSDKPRLCNVIQWSIQTVAALMVFFSSSDWGQWRSSVLLVLLLLSLPVQRLLCRVCGRGGGIPPAARGDDDDAQPARQRCVNASIAAALMLHARRA